MDALTAEVKALAAKLGFVRAGVARVEPLHEDAGRLRAWLAAGRHGTMKYLEETADVRADITHAQMLQGACSVIALATPYPRDNDEVGLEPGRIARYAHGRDYHGLLYDRTRGLKRLLREHGALARSCVDTMPVLERAWAARAGLGFIGKNAMLIIPGLGSHVLLTVIVTNASLTPDEPMQERCGACTLCLEACPTRAFVAPRELDARRCISYLTIEHDDAIDAELRKDMGAWLFGCDVCQDVCPYNRTKLPAPEATQAFAPKARWSELGADDFLRMSEADFDRYSRGTPLRRAGRIGMARNAAIVLGNTGDKRYLPVLQASASHDTSEIVRDAAAWACERISSRRA
jgi:epoxyqueuosine reductase